MESPLRTMLLEQDFRLEAEERQREQELTQVRAKREAIATLLASESDGQLVKRGDGVLAPTGIRKAKPAIPRPRRGWTKIIRDVLTVHPDSTFKEIMAYANSGNMAPGDVKREEFEKRMKFALRDLTSKNFTIIQKLDKKTPARYTLNPDK